MIVGVVVMIDGPRSRFKQSIKAMIFIASIKHYEKNSNQSQQTLMQSILQIVEQVFL